MSPRILILDIETSPTLAWVYQKYQATVLKVEKDWIMMSFSWKWLGDAKVQHRQLPNYPRYQTNRDDDLDLVRELWKLYDQADIVIGHNLDRFDTKMCNARFLFHSIPPPPPSKSIDTLKIAKKYFRLFSNSLDHVATHVGVGRKLEHNGTALWFKCLAGDAKAWRLMEKYNNQDVRLTEKVYLKLRAWQSNPIDLNIYTGEHACPACQSNHVSRKGFRYTKSGRKQQFRCRSCKHYFTVGKVIKAWSSSHRD